MRPLAPTRRRVLHLGAAALLAGCAPALPPLRPDAGLPTRAAVSGVPLIEQSRFHCGPAALAMALQWAGDDVTEADLARASFTPTARGTYQADMLGAVRRRGRLAVELRGFEALTAEIAAGRPVVVFQNLGLSAFPVWHYAVAVAYDLGESTVTLHSGERDVMVMGLGVFRRTWERAGAWALAFPPPGEFPAQVRERDALAAAAGLERAGHPRAAADAYRAGARRWPGSWLWPFGLGNALYAQGDLEGAEAAFRHASALDPDAPEPRANLAQVRAERRA